MEAPQGLAPMLWLERMPYGRLLRTFCAEGPRSPSLRTHMDAISGITRSDELLHHDLQRVAVVEMSRLERHEGLKPGESMVSDAIVSSDVAIFHMFGRQVFHLEDGLAEELSHTDVGDVPPSEVRMPHLAFYLTFGGTAAREAGLGDVQGLLVTAEPSDPTYLNVTAMRMEDGRPVAVDTGYLDLDRGETMDECLADAEEDVARSDPTSDVATDGDPRSDVIHAGFKAHNARQVAGMVRLRRAMTLLVNAILYIDSPRAGRRSGWHPDTPRDLSDRADGTTGAAKAQQRLVREGWTRVTLMTLEDGEVADADGPGQPRRTHWRRGHWRRQRHGVGNAMVKRVRIRPVRVVGRAGGEVQGHVYHLTGDGRHRQADHPSPTSP